jgi:NitT/TauT family transport system substrate-binding protein
VVALALAGCGDDSGGGAEPGQETTLKVGTLPIANAAPLYIGIDKGFFAQEKLRIEPQVGEGGNQIITTIVSGDNQFGFIGVLPAIVARSKGLPIKVVSANDQGAKEQQDSFQVLMVAKGSPVEDAKDLAGKTIAVNALKGVAEVSIKASLAKQGVDPGSIKLLEVPFPEMPAALEDGRVDAILATEPFLTQVLEAGGRQVDAPFESIAPDLINGVYVTSEEYIDKNPDVVDRFVRAMNRSVEYAAAHPDEVRGSLPAFTAIKPALAEEIRLPSLDAEIDRGSIELNADLALRYRIIERAPTVEELVRSP